MLRLKEPAQVRKNAGLPIFVWLLGLVISFALGASVPSCAPQGSIGVFKAGWMPEGASDGAFAHGGTSIIFSPAAYFYEYTISEADFRKEANRRNWPLEEITEPIHVRRYLTQYIRQEEFLQSPKATDTDGLDAYWKAIHAKVEKGLIYRHQIANRITVFAYNRTNRRAYLFLTTR